VADTAIVKASLEYIGDADGGPVDFGFNPTEYTLTASTSWKQTPSKGKGSPKSEYTGNLPETVTIDAFFISDWGGRHRDVFTELLNLRMMTWPTDESVSKAKPSAPLLMFRWGKRILFSPCHLKSVTIRHTMFDETGEVTRATASITLEEVLEDVPGQNPTSGGLAGSRAHVVASGDSLASIAFREYDNAALWRGLADLNGIDDPMRLRTGQRLIVPPYEQVAARS
jgi:nucleoid-associated protein YgaU